jgi:membrane associated rhomboid family serine protease
MREWSATTWLITVFLGVFLLDAMTTPVWQMDVYSPIVRATSFSYEAAIEHHQFWRFLTFPLAHVHVWALALNLMSLSLLVRGIGDALGGKRLVALFATCSLAAPFTYVAIHHWHFSIEEPWFALSGASAGVLGILVAAAYAGPNDEVAIWNTGLILPRRTLAWFAAALLAIVVIKQDPTGASSAHLGGAVAGILLLPIVRRWMRRPRRTS